MGEGVSEAFVEASVKIWYFRHAEKVYRGGLRRVNRWLNGRCFSEFCTLEDFG